METGKVSVVFFFRRQEVADDAEGVMNTTFEVFIKEKILPSRKYVLDITSESLTKRLSIQLHHIHSIAKRESGCKENSNSIS